MSLSSAWQLGIADELQCRIDGRLTVAIEHDQMVGSRQAEEPPSLSHRAGREAAAIGTAPDGVEPALDDQGRGPDLAAYERRDLLDRPDYVDRGLEVESAKTCLSRRPSAASWVADGGPAAAGRSGMNLASGRR